MVREKNEDTKERLELEFLVSLIERTQLKWYGTISKTSEERISRKVLDANLNG